MEIICRKCVFLAIWTLCSWWSILMWGNFNVIEPKIERISVFSVYLINISWKQNISLKYDQQNLRGSPRSRASRAQDRLHGATPLWSDSHESQQQGKSPRVKCWSTFKKNHFRSIFSPFQAISSNFGFFNLKKKNCQKFQK